MLDVKFQNRILSFIEKNEFGCSSTDISKNLKINRLTIAKYLSVMRTEGLIDFKKIGMAKAWYAEKSPLLWLLKSSNNGNHIKSLLNFIEGEIIVVDQNLRIVWANAEWETKHGKHKNKFCYLTSGRKAVCPECPVLKSFETKRVERKLCENTNQEARYIETAPIKDSHGEVIAAIEFSKVLPFAGGT